MRLFPYNAVIFFMIVVLSSCSKQPPDKALEQVAMDYFNHISNNDFETAAALFHYPADYTPQELMADKNAITRALGVVNNEFGGIGSKKKIDSLENYIYLVISGGNTPYWDKHSYSIPWIYEVTFGKEGQGNVILFLCKIENKWEIQKVEYCLPVLRPDSRMRMNEIIEKMFNAVSPVPSDKISKDKVNTL